MTEQKPVVFVQQTNFTKNNDGDGVNEASSEVTKAWVLIDEDGEGNFDASTVMVIELAGVNATITGDLFSAIPT